MQYYYSLYGTPLHLLLEEKIADGYNRTHDAFLEAQQTFKEEYGIQWTPELPLEIKASPEETDAYNKIAQLVNLLVEINGGELDITEEQMTTHRLIRV